MKIKENNHNNSNNLLGEAFNVEMAAQNNNNRRPHVPIFSCNEAPPNQMNQIDTSMNVETHYQEIISTLNRITDNREVNMVSVVLILIVALFFGYMAIDFGLVNIFAR